MHLLLIIVIFAALLALGYASFSFFEVKKMDEGTEKMREIASAIRLGANTFIIYEYKLIAKITAVIAVIIAVVLGWQTACAFVIGAVMSASAGWVGMKIATYANVRVTNKARLTNSLGETLKVAFQGGSVMGLCVAGFALLGIFIVYIVFGILFKQIDAVINLAPSRSLVGFETSFSITLSGYALGCSIIALFNRVGGGIYTKAADMGADLVGKTEAHIPEDDPRNPATIADNVGDNVGDVAGLGSDLLESYVGAILSAVILAAELFKSAVARNSSLLGTEYVELVRYMMYFPIIFAALGLVACVIGIGYLLTKKKLSENPHMELNMATWVSAGITLVFGLVLSILIFNGFDSETLKIAGFAIGRVSPWLASSLGIIAGIVIGMIAEYYTSYDFKPTRKIAHSSIEGAALTITQGMANGMISTMAPVAVLGFAIFGSYKIAGMYGIACAAFGMLSFVATTVSVDTYGPISDNAGGIAEMSKLDKNVRSITDKLDSVGNTTAAIGKGFAIGSAAFAALSMMSSYMYTWIDASKDIVLNLLDPLILAGALIGAALPFLFSGMLIEAVANAARKMVDEVRRQFREIKGLLQGEVLPDYKTCIAISTEGALKEMRVPALMSILFTVISGFLFGPLFVGGILIGATISAVMLAIFTGNAGGAWDNAKKYIETGAIDGHEKGSDAHSASIVGDTVGDPLKDTVGPSLDILIKIMSTISLVSVVTFSQYNLLKLLGL
ncbi:MAG: sodium-translocating pyrophosphatase [Clostridiaceae bacterium]|jgi:K(+)-stimulated pyrophosphate-energized sodium pump|nr:sodium-translocating pyrophosphatase [Clostridiaceae bacterium]